MHQIDQTLCNSYMELYQRENIIYVPLSKPGENGLPPKGYQRMIQEELTKKYKPGLNLGILLPTSSLVLLDIDTFGRKKNSDGTLKQPGENEIDGIKAILPYFDRHPEDFETLMSQTPSGGWHIYYKYDQKLMSNWNEKQGIYHDGKKYAWDLKIKIYAMAPPSYISKYDNSYAWINDPIDGYEAINMPKWLIQLINNSDGERDSIKDVKKSREQKLDIQKYLDIPKDEILSLLSSWRSDEYDPWKDVMLALSNTDINEGEAIDLMEEFCRRSDKFDEKKFKIFTRQFLKSKKTNSKLLSFASIVYWAEKDNSSGLKALYKKHYSKYKSDLEVQTDVIIPFNPKENYYWSTFKAEFANKEFNTLIEVDQLLLPNFKRVFGILQKGSGLYYTKNKDDPFLGEPRFKADDFCIFIKKTGKTESFQEYTLKDLIKKYTTYISFDMVVFHPYKISENRVITTDKNLNIFPGFQSSYIPDEPYQEICQPILSHIKKIFANNNEDNYKYILSHLAFPFQNPGQKCRSCVMLITRTHQTAMKTRFFEFMSLYVYGPKLATIINDLQNKLLGRFGAHLENKLLVCLDDIHFIKQIEVEQLKSIITGKTSNYEAKGKNITEDKRDFINLFAILNYEGLNNLRLNEGDARFAIFETSDIDYGIEYTTKMSDIFDNQKIADAFVTYLMHYSCIPLRPVPITSIKQEIQEESLPLPLLFFKHIKNNLHDLKYDKLETNSITGESLFTQYSDWAKENSRSQKDITYTINSFKKLVYRYIGKTGDPIRLGIKTVRLYTISLEGDYK